MASIFQTTYSGLGLTVLDYAAFATLLTNGTNGTFSCLNGICGSNSSCSSQSAYLTEFSFLAMWTSYTSDYLNIPLQTFAVANATTGGCTLLVGSVGTNYTIFGSQFFTNFLGSFTTDVTAVS